MLNSTFCTRCTGYGGIQDSFILAWLVPSMQDDCWLEIHGLWIRCLLPFDKSLHTCKTGLVCSWVPWIVKRKQQCWKVNTTSVGKIQKVFDIVNNSHEKFNFCCLTEQRNFIFIPKSLQIMVHSNVYKPGVANRYFLYKQYNHYIKQY